MALHLSMSELTDLRARVAGRRDAAYAERRANKRSRQRKYGNQPTEVDGMAFDSKAEARYYAKLALRLKAGEIQNLQRQVPFVLAPAVVIAGRKRPALRYIADFTYEQDGELVVCDVKGVAADVYRVKRHLMKSVHGIDIVEIRS